MSHWNEVRIKRVCCGISRRNFFRLLLHIKGCSLQLSLSAVQLSFDTSLANWSLPTECEFISAAAKNELISFL